MSNNVLIIGESGSGKSTSIRTLPPEQTFIINVINKPLPFKGANKLYTPLSTDGLTGNYYASDDHAKIMRAIALVNAKRPEIKYLVLDDFGYSITNDFMRNALVKGYDKFSSLAKDAWETMKAVNETRQDLICFMMLHSESDNHGKSKPKTIGKMLDEKVCIEGMFSVVLHTVVTDGNYQFLTNQSNHYMAKSPMGMFNQLLIPNDLMLVSSSIENYLNDDIK
jgi:hypothetical protein